MIVRGKLGASFCFALASSAWAGGSKAPKEEPLPVLPQPLNRQLKKVVELNTIRSSQIINDQQLGFAFEQLINAQFAEVVLSTGRFTVKAKRGDEVGTLVMNNGSAVFASLLDQPMASVVDQECYMNLAHIRMNGQVMGFEVTQSTGLTLGYNPGRGLVGLGAQFSFRATKAAMNLAINATDIFDRRLLGTGVATEKQSETRINASIGYQDISLGFDHFKKTPLSRVSGRALTFATHKVALQTDPLQWDGRVIVADRDYVGINAGQDAGIRLGDQFLVTNMTHYWRGEACASAYLGARAEQAPVAVVEVYDVDFTNSWARVVQYLGSEREIRSGGRVSIRQLVQ
jgi:hypothetical protein